MKNSFYKDIIDKGNIGYAYQELILSDNKITDLLFINTNSVFNEVFNTEIIDNTYASCYENKLFEYFNYLKFSLNFSFSIDFEGGFTFYSRAKGKTFSCQLYFREENHLVSVFKAIEGINDPLLDNTGRYKMIVENMNDLIWILDERFNLTYLSPSATKLFGYHLEELSQSGIKKILPREEYKKAIKLYKEQLIKEKLGGSELHRIITREFVHVNDKGELSIVEHLIQFIRDLNGHLIGVMGIGRDITQWVGVKKEIVENRDKLELILNSTQEGIIGVDNNGLATFCNASFLKMFAYTSQEEFLAKDYQSLIKNDSSLTFGYELSNELQKHTFVRNDGSTFVGEYNKYPQYSGKEIVGAVVTFIDTSNITKVEKELKETARSKQVLISNFPGFVYRCSFDKYYTMEYISDGCFSLTGYLSDQFINNRDISFNDIIDEDFRLPLWNAWLEAKEKKSLFKEIYKISTASGGFKWVLEQGQVVFNDHGDPFVLEGLIIDVTEIIQYQEKIEYLSYHDSLTGLYSRSYLDNKISFYDNKYYYPLSIIVADINGLKLLNDAVGHQEGDKLIIATAEILIRSFKKDTIIARTGGDEFSILLPNTSSDEAYKMLINTQDVIHAYNADIDKASYKLSIALGYGTKESEGIDFSKIQKVAEDKMYKRKLLERSSSHSSIISSIKATMFEKSEDTEEHAERLKSLTILFGQKIGLDQEQLIELSLLATLHDIGKVGIDEKILNKPGPLTETEWLEMKKHPEIGYRITMASTDLKPLSSKILHHHERWDGSGYPKGLTGINIPLLSRIIAITDSYDAMTNDRPYRRALDKGYAIAEIRRCLGTQFDPSLGEKFIELIQTDLDFLEY